MLKESCRRLISYVDTYTGASFFYEALVHCEVLDTRWIEALDLFRVRDSYVRWIEAVDLYFVRER
jgi:hypothetical protein